MPNRVAPIESSRFRAIFTIAFPNNPLSIRVIVSQENVENVVNAPRRPVMSNLFNVVERFRCWKYRDRNPIRRLPNIFTLNVPIGIVEFITLFDIFRYRKLLKLPD